jgi:hypothetical protein
MVARIIQNQIDRIEYREKSIFWIFFSVFIFLLVSYGFMVNKTIVNAVSKQKTEKDIIVLNSEVNSIESKYLDLKNNITIDLALSKGFIVNENIKYVVNSVSDQKVSLSINEN